MAVVTVYTDDGHKRLSFIDWFHSFTISDTGNVLGTTLELTFPSANDEGLPYEGYYEIDAYAVCNEWDNAIPAARIPTYLAQTLDVKGSGEAYFNVDKSLNYSQGVGTNASIYNNSLQGSAIIYVTGEGCSDRKANIKFTGPQVGTTYVQVSAGYVTLRYLGKNVGSLCEDS